MASGKSQYSKEIINDTTESTRTTYSSQHIKELVDDAQGKVSASSDNAIEEKTDGLYVKTPSNKATLDKLSADSDGDLNYNNNKVSHEHDNKTDVLDKLTIDTDGDLNYNSSKVMDTSILKEFQANHLYVQNEAIVVEGRVYTRNSTGTSGSSFDETEKANWTALNITTSANETRRIRCNVNTKSMTTSSGFTYINNTYLEGDNSLKSGNNFIASVSGLYYMYITSIQVSVSTDINVGILKNTTESGSNWIALTKRTSSSYSSNVCTTVWLNEGDYLYPVIYSGDSSSIILSNWQPFIEFGLLSIGSDLINKPNLWEVGTEYDFGDGLYGQRFTGTLSVTNGVRADIYTGVLASKLVDSGGEIAKPYWTVNVNGYFDNNGSNNGSVVWINNYTTNIKGISLALTFPYTGTVTYDFWAKYLK